MEATPRGMTATRRLRTPRPAFVMAIWWLCPPSAGRPRRSPCVALTPNAACPYLYMERAHGGCTGVQANVPSPVRPSRPSASQASFSSLHLQHTSRTSGSPKHTTAWPVNEQRLSSHRRRAPRRQPPVPPRDRRRRDGHARPAAASRLHRLSRAARGRAQADQGRASARCLAAEVPRLTESPFTGPAVPLGERPGSSASDVRLMARKVRGLGRGGSGGRSF